ncbi:MAG: extracellular solute-binding protein [Clostridia bacterium]|nr:extracellular solute-binding protein [Clostridia bacterium]
MTKKQPSMRSRLFTAASALLLLAAFSACGNDTETNPSDSKNTGTETAAESAAPTPGDNHPALQLEDRDFGGAPYRISCYQEADLISLYTDATNGEAVNDAIYARNSMLEEKYNFKIKIDSTEDYSVQNQNVSTLILANDDAYELIYGHVVATCNNAISHLYKNLYEVPYLDFTQPWWPAQSVEQMTVYDKMYTICSGINYRQLAASKVLFFNKDLLTAHDLETPYSSVLDGTWTMDRLIAATKGLYQDVNGNSERDLDDLYGFTSYATQNGFLLSCDAQILAPTPDGGREIAVMSDKMVNLVEKLYGWYYESGDVFLASYERDKPDFIANIFGGGHAVYSFGHLEQAVDFYRNSDIKYGIAPMPKYDEAQSSYYVFACPSLFSIPQTCQNAELAGFVLEAMTYYGYYDIIPAYYELTMQGKIADSSDDVAMLEIINDNLTVSFAYCYDNWEGFAHLLGSRMNFTQKKGSKDMASMYKKYEKTAQRRLDLVLDGFRDIE